MFLMRKRWFSDAQMPKLIRTCFFAMTDTASLLKKNDLVKLVDMFISKKLTSSFDVEWLATYSIFCISCDRGSQ